MTDKANSKKLPTESYKGVRDFYPEDLFVQNYIFNTWRKAVESFGYEEYSASILESTDIYKAKSGQELVNEQTYSFVDRGEREVTLRPEMTPSLARMVAAKKRELGFPLRLYSIPNCFRYERPQRGRMREFWQLNVDLLTKKSSPRYDVEIIQVVSNLMKAFGAKDSDFTIKINSRVFANVLYTEYYKLSGDAVLAFQKLMDKKNKLTNEEFEVEYKKLTSVPFLDLNNSANVETLRAIPSIKTSLDILFDTIELCKKAGVANVEFDSEIVRGLDYYTGTVFEVFDTNPENNRALFGGGRYDNLIDMFEGPADDSSISGIGFGYGDVPMMNFLESRNLLPVYNTKTTVLVGVLDDAETTLEYADEVTANLRASENVAVSYTSRKYPDLVKLAQKFGIKKVVMIGESEVANKSFEVKEI